MANENRYELKAYGASISEINYYNDRHKVIRIKHNKNYYDFKYFGGHIVPSPEHHVAIVVTNDESLLETRCVTPERQNFLPGILDDKGTLADLPFGLVWCVPKKQTVSVTNPNSGGAGFAISKTNMFDLDKVSVAISPPLEGDYTNTESKENLSNKSVGIFINKDGTILIKSIGSSITMGKEGVYIAGNVSWESSEHQRGIMMDNTLQRFIPSTIVTFPISFPEYPNLSLVAQIANGATKVRQVVKVIDKAAGVLT
jgi:hypothetical protein